MSKHLLGWLLGALFSSHLAHANIVGTDYQNFNPISSGIDFVTVQSSETLKPCLCNLGVFINYAQNTLTYSEQFYSLNSVVTDLRGRRSKDSLTYADLNMGIGLGKNWDMGIAFPFVISARSDDPYGVSYFEKNGLTEVRLSTKYRLFGDARGGLALIGTVNLNTIQDNPFAGDKAGPTFNFEVAADTTKGKWALGGNLGYRKRNPGSPVKDANGQPKTPFVPYQDSWIYSAAASYYMTQWDSKLIIEVLGSKSAKEVQQDTARTQEALEFLAGVKHDWSQSMAVHFGGGTKLANAQASPDFRVYAGMNYVIGPVCDTKPKMQQVVQEPPLPSEQSDKLELVYEPEAPIAVIIDHPVGVSPQTKLNMGVTALDIEEYRWKMGPSSSTDCFESSDYSRPILGHFRINKDISSYPEGGVTVCAVAKNKAGIWQSFEVPTIVQWIKGTRSDTAADVEAFPQIPPPLETRMKYELFRLSAEVLFDFDKDVIQARAFADLERIANHLKVRGFTKLIIEGHTDSIGSDAYNLDLSSRRARQVKKYLQDTYGFEVSKIEAVGKGEKFPVADNGNYQGRQENRRVEFKIYRGTKESGVKKMIYRK